ncbi:undecaprenyl-diphosphatase [Mesobacillus subterraneus]|uniref:undecaprenyl-diphosphatase n=1 Tax=Mesobacillus subterraneus TaxID=285983 RepID=UPI00273F0F72|nr:undecaprenyl-diphosphatase [Mesobacillus subterraneus]WLR57537.1 undecaprenyl-diphosphatase [Mesobacillus subterraneus]
MDLRLFQQMNKLSGQISPVDHSMIFISKRLRYVYLIVIVMLLFKNRKNKRIALETGSSVLISVIVQFFIKLFYAKPRPFQKRRVGILIPSKMDSSFPSKHTILAFAASTSILLFHRKLGTIMMWMSALTGFSRIWVDHHYPSDILGSALLGSLISLVTRIVSFSKFGNNPESS